MSKNLFIAGTGTDVGKTFVTGLIVKKLYQSGRSAAYFKAAASGNLRSSDGTLIFGDGLSIKNSTGISQSLKSMCPYVYEAAVSPHFASQLEGNPVKIEFVKSCFERLSQEYEYITVEGSGGILCPLCIDEKCTQLEDIIKTLNLSCLIVADAGLGTINAVGLTAFYMRERNIPIKGIIFNRFHSGNAMEEDNLKMCEAITGLRVIACVGDGDTEININADTLASLYE
jgi:dethiobiotin synthase